MNRIKTTGRLLLATLLSLTGMAGMAPAGAQTATVEIGVGNSMANTDPINTSFSYGYSQTIYTAGEITSNGAPGAGVISKIRYYLQNVGTPASSWASWTVYIGHTTKTEFNSSTDWVAAGTMTQVFSGNIPQTGGTWIELQLATPFTWNGTSNLVIAVDENSASNTPTNPATWRVYGTGYNRNLAYFSNATNPNPASPPTATVAPNSSSAQIQLVMTALPCSGTPAAGTTTSSSNTVCSGASFSLSVNGSSTWATGLAYQWEQSSNGTTYTPVSGATAASLSTTQNGPTYYRRVTTCTNSGASATSTPKYVTMNGFPNCYCTPGSYMGATYGGISNVKLNTLNSSSELEYYPPFTSFPALGTLTTTLNQGATYSLSIGHTYGSYAAWIDWNRNDLFDATEYIPIGDFSVDGTSYATVTVPNSANIGQTKMRIRGSDVPISSDQACTSFEFGESEDYFINVSTGTYCTGTPGTTTVIAPTVVCSDAGINLNATGLPAVGTPGISYQWQSSANGVTYTNITGGTSVPYTTSQSAATYYRLVVACTASGLSSTSAGVLVGISSTPATPTVVAPSGACPSTPFDLSATGLPGNGTGSIAYQWQSSTDGATYTNIAYATTVPYTRTQSAATYYRLVVTCTISGLSTTSAGVLVPMSPSNTCYCYPAVPSYYYEPDGIGLTSVLFGTANHRVYNVTGAEPYGYGNYDTLVGDMVAGQDNYIATTWDLNGESYQFKVYIDLNNDGDFADANEASQQSSTYFSPVPSVTYFAIPAGTTPGHHRMRISASSTWYYGGGEPAPACGGGEDVLFEDYMVNVIVPQVCSGMPEAGYITTIGPSSYCGSIPVDKLLVLEGYNDSVTYTTIQWQVSTDNVNFTNTYYSNSFVTGVFASNVSGTNYTRYYRAIVGCVASDLRDTTGVFALTVSPYDTTVPTLVITPSTGTTICAGSNVTFYSNTNIPGATRQWKKNGVNIPGATNISYFTNALANGDVITAVITAPAGTCYNPGTLTSNAVTMTVNPVTTTTSVISASPGNTVCTGTPVTFTSSTNVPGTVTRQWTKNNVNIAGATGATYTYTPANGDAIRCRIVAAAGQCYTTIAVTSAPIVMSVGTPASPVATITVSPGTTLCAGATATFTASVTNGGSAPSYSWRKNNVAVGSNSPTYSVAPANGDVIYCIVNNNSACAATPVDTSNALTMTVLPAGTTTSTISVSPNDTVCAGTAVTFTSVTNVPGALTRQWTKNNVYITGATGATYTYTPANNDAIRCIVTAAAGQCFNTTAVTSAPITMRVNPVVTPTVSITSNYTTVCTGTNVTFTSTSNVTGATRQWRKNGVAISGATNVNYATNALANGDVITCVVTIPAGGCVTNTTATSNAITMTVTPVTTTTSLISVAPNDTVNPGTSLTFTSTTNVPGAVSRQWTKNNVVITGATGPTYTYVPAHGDAIRCRVIAAAGQCYSTVAVTSAPITIRLYGSFIAGPGQGGQGSGDGNTALARAEEIHAYPNPTGDLLNIAGLHAGDDFSLTDGAGRVLLRQAARSNAPQQISLAAFAPGLYYLHANGQVIKIVKQ